MIGTRLKMIQHVKEQGSYRPALSDSTAMFKSDNFLFHFIESL